MSEFQKRERNTVRRLAKRGRYDRDSIYGILDEGFLCHLGFIVEDQPYVIPTLYGRSGDTIFVHGSSVSRMLKNLSEGVRVCVTVTITDGIVLARSAFHHSMNYRSVTAFGTGVEIADGEEKMNALKVISESVLPGRWEKVRLPNQKELNVTTVIAIEIEDAAAKMREGDPQDDTADYELPIWAGVIPLVNSYGIPIADSLLDKTIEVPQHVKDLYDETV